MSQTGGIWGGYRIPIVSGLFSEVNKSIMNFIEMMAQNRVKQIVRARGVENGEGIRKGGGGRGVENPIQVSAVSDHRCHWYCQDLIK